MQLSKFKLLPGRIDCGRRISARLAGAEKCFTNQVLKIVFNSKNFCSKPGLTTKRSLIRDLCFQFVLIA